jgi:ring-1,2-phenylacetyl-CoA epoxidase subunit PaaE
MQHFYKLTIKEIIKETPSAVSISFEIPNNLKDTFNFKAGQYITIKKELAGEELRRAYSICSTPKSNEFKIVVKAVDNGNFSVFATTILKKGDVLEVSAPEGKFILEPQIQNKKHYLTIAAGSGITPIFSIIKTALEQEPNSTATLIYGNKTFSETIFKNQIDALKELYLNRFNVVYLLSREQQANTIFGRIDEGNLNFLLKNTFKNTSFDAEYLCGPEEMILTAKKVLTNLNYAENTIAYELFSTPLTNDNSISNSFEGSCNVTVILDDEETSFTMDSKQTVLTAALKNGLDAPYSCQGGICSSCMALVTEGKAIMDKNSILSEAEIADGFILTCQAHPITEKIKIDFDNV